MKKHLILMLEYDEDDQYLTRDYFRSYNNIDLKIVSSSEEVLAYFQQCKQGTSILPSLLLLNYNSTPLNAVQLLAEVKRNQRFSHIPSVVLSGTVVPSIVKDCYLNGASSFIQKPALVDDTLKKIGGFVEYWFRTVELPD